MTRPELQFRRFRHAVPDQPLGRPTRFGVDVRTGRTRYAQCADKRRVSGILYVWNTDIRGDEMLHDSKIMYKILCKL